MIGILEKQASRKKGNEFTDETVELTSLCVMEFDFESTNNVYPNLVTPTQSISQGTKNVNTSGFEGDSVRGDGTTSSFGMESNSAMTSSKIHHLTDGIDDIPFLFDFWYKNNSFDGSSYASQFIFDVIQGSAQSEANYRVTVNPSSEIGFSLFTDISPLERFLAVGAAPANPQNYNHYTIIGNGDKNDPDIRIFINGQEVNVVKTNQNYTGMNGGNTAFRFGREWSGGSLHINGEYDLLRLFKNTDFTKAASYANTLYNNGIGVKLF